LFGDPKNSAHPDVNMRRNADPCPGGCGLSACLHLSLSKPMSHASCARLKSSETVISIRPKGRTWLFSNYGGLPAAQFTHEPRFGDAPVLAAMRLTGAVHIFAVRARRYQASFCCTATLARLASSRGSTAESCGLGAVGEPGGVSPFPFLARWPPRGIHSAKPGGCDLAQRGRPWGPRSGGIACRRARSSARSTISRITLE
jgi:hypothetical protein